MEIRQDRAKTKLGRRVKPSERLMAVTQTASNKPKTMRMIHAVVEPSS